MRNAKEIQSLKLLYIVRTNTTSFPSHYSVLMHKCADSVHISNSSISYVYIDNNNNNINRKLSRKFIVSTVQSSFAFCISLKLKSKSCCLLSPKMLSVCTLCVGVRDSSWKTVSTLFDCKKMSFGRKPAHEFDAKKEYWKVKFFSKRKKKTKKKKAN